MQRNFKKQIAIILTVMMTVMLIPATSYAADEADDVKCSVEQGDKVVLDGDKFNHVCDDLNDGSLYYIRFDTVPSSSKGILYYDYKGSDQEKVNTSDKYYYNDDPSIDDITFVADDEYSGTVTVDYTGYDKDTNDYTGALEITVTKEGTATGDIEYKIDTNEKLKFDEDDFNDFCEDENGETLDYIKFTLPSSSKGTLYYDYSGDKDKVTTSDEYYYDDDPAIGDITFVPAKDYSGSCTISFSGEDRNGDSIDGKVLIKIGSSDTSSITLSGAAGSPVLMPSKTFNSRCSSAIDDTLDYVKFTLPSSSSGTLYYNYTSSTKYTSTVTASTKYYYDDSDTPSLGKVAFVSAGTSAGTYTIKYTGYGQDGDSFTGEIKITVSKSTVSTTASQYFVDVNASYSWAASYIDTLYSVGIVKGSMGVDGMTHYYPASNITRADFMLLLMRALNLSSTSSSGNFSDVPQGSYYYNALATAKAMGIAQGSDGRFYPTATITREDAMVLAQRALSVSGNSTAVGTAADLSKYADNWNVSSYAKDAIASLIKAGIVTGNDGYIYPKNSITRAEAAAIIYRIKY